MILEKQTSTDLLSTLERITTGNCLRGHKIKFDILLPFWIETFRKNYDGTKYRGVCPYNGKTGLIVPDTLKWSPINQFNTNYSAQTILIKFINDLIIDNYLSKDINKINYRPIKLIEFDKDKCENSSDYIINQLRNYFFWVDYFSKDIFKDIDTLTSNDILYHMIEMVNSTMAKGMWGELILCSLMKQKNINIFRYGGMGSKEDMNTGVDLYTLENNIKTTYQIKMFKVYDEYTIKNKVNFTHYEQKGIDVMSCVDLVNEKIINIDIKKCNSTKEDILSEDSIMETMDVPTIFSSSILYKFYLYCIKLNFNFEITLDSNKFSHIIEDKNINLTIPKNIDDFNVQYIKNLWETMINEYENVNNKEYELEQLKNLFQ
jgi:hypothetical protein